MEPPLLHHPLPSSQMFRYGEKEVGDGRRNGSMGFTTSSTTSSAHGAESSILDLSPRKDPNHKVVDKQ